MLIKKKMSSLLSMIGLIAYIMYHRSSTNMIQINQQAKEDQGIVVSSNVNQDESVAVHGGNVKRFFLDKDGNEIPVFDENTVYPKPGGGYCNMTPITDKEEYFQALENPTVKCKDLQDNVYKVCLDDFKKKNNCLVLSFGINYNFKFEDLMVDRHGCQAYSFDPTMDKDRLVYIRKNGKDKFFDLGLSSFKGFKTITYENRRNRICAVDRYVNIVKMLGIAEKEIDFLKIDIEGSELDFFLDTASNHPELIKNVKQVLIEFHNLEGVQKYHSGNHNSTTVFDMMKIVKILQCHGFALAYTSMNPVQIYHFWYNNKKRGCCYVNTWIRA